MIHSLQAALLEAPLPRQWLLYGPVLPEDGQPLAVAESLPEGQPETLTVAGHELQAEAVQFTHGTFDFFAHFKERLPHGVPVENALCYAVAAFDVSEAGTWEIGAGADW